MATTFLQAVNRTLTKLREPTVSDVTGNNSYQQLIIQLVNEAHEEVEKATDWNYQATTFSGTTDGSDTITLTGWGEEFTLDVVYNDADNYIIRGPFAAEEIERLYNGIDTTIQTAMYYSVYGTDASNDPILKFYPSPSSGITIKAFGRVRTGWLSDASDVIKVPWLPVTLLAYAMAISERGEDGGTPYNEAYQNYISALARSVAADANTGHRDINWKIC